MVSCGNALYEILFYVDRGRSRFLLVAYHHTVAWGNIRLSDSCRDAELIIGISRKLVYLELFLLFMFAMGYWHLPQTAPIIMGTFVLGATFLNFTKEEMSKCPESKGVDCVEV